MNKIAFLIGFFMCMTAFGQSADDYQEFFKSVESIVAKGREVAATQQEQADLRILQWNLGQLKTFVAKGDWTSAEHLKRRMEASLKRGAAVAADAPRRKAARERAEQERRHREVMSQNERQHKELMSEVRNRANPPVIYTQPRSSYTPVYTPRTTTVTRGR